MTSLTSPIIDHDLGDNGIDYDSDSDERRVKTRDGGNFQLNVSTAKAADLATVAALEVLNDDKLVSLAKADAAKNKKGGNDNDNNNEDKAPTTEPLTSDELSRGIARLTPLTSNDSDVKAFNKRESSLKAPQTGDINIPFPPDDIKREEVKMDSKTLEALGQSQHGELKVERTSPMDGGRLTIPLSKATLTFNQPMIAVASVDEVKAEHAGLGITITPEHKGVWQWTGTQTLQYIAEHRFRYATSYSIKVPRALTSAIGGELKNEFELKFSTSPPRIIASQPSSRDIVQTLRPHIIVLFDQDIDVNAVAAVMTVTGGLTVSNGGLILTDRQTALTTFKKLIKRGRENRWIAFTPKADLKPHTSYDVTFPIGTPSAEGPLLTVQEQSVKFSTYPAFTVTNQYPDGDVKWHQANPGAEFSVTFSNDIKVSTVTKDLFHWSPALPSFSVEAKRNGLTIYNHSKANATYKLTIDRKVTDVHGQSLTGKNELTFKVGAEVKPEGRLQGPSGIITLDPLLKPVSYPILITNFDELDISIYRVDPWHSMSTWRVWDHSQQVARDREHHWIPDKLRVHHETKKFPGLHRDEPFEYRVDVSKYLQDQKQQVGQVIVIVVPTNSALDKTNGGEQRKEYRPMAAAWLQVTRLSLDPFMSGRPGAKEVIAWVNDLATGRPVTGANVCHQGSAKEVVTGTHGVTDARGLVRINAGLAATGEECPLVATLGTDTVFIANYNVYANRPLTHAWFVFDDRQLYKPKETVSIKGYVRRLERKGEACTPVYVTGDVEYTVKDPRGQQLAKGMAKLTAYGSFDFTFELKDNVNLGQGRVELYKVVPKGSDEPKVPMHYHSFKIQEYRKPEFKATASHRPSAGAVHVTSTTGSVVVADIAATYFAGGPLTDANVTWKVTPTRATYTPPNRSKFQFEKYKPWYRHAYYDDSEGEPTLNEVLDYGKTDGTGTHQLKISYGGIPEPPVPVLVTANASVRDKNNQTIEASTNFIVHPCQYYIGHNQVDNFGKLGEPVTFDLVVAGIDGSVIAGIPYTVTIRGEGSERVEDSKTGMVEWKKVNDDRTITGVSDKDEFKWSFTPTIGGNYTVIFAVTDTAGGRHRSSRSFYVSGGFSEIKSQKIDRVPQQQLEVVPNKKIYNPGETAQLMIVSPFSPATGFVVISCEGICGTPLPFSIDRATNSTVVSFVVKEEWIPAFDVNVEVAGEAPRSNAMTGAPDPSQPSRPAYARATVSLEIPLMYHGINVNVSPKDVTQQAVPGSSVTVRVSATDRNQKPVANAEVAIVMVDEAVLSLTGYRVSDPLSAFYPRRYGGYDRQSTRSSCILVSSDELERLRREAEERKAAEKKALEDAAAAAADDDGEESLQMEGAAFGGTRDRISLSASSLFGGAPRGAAAAGGRALMKKGGAMRMMALSSAVPQAAFASSTMDGAAGGGGSYGGEDNSIIAVRSNFNPLASFHPQARTDAKGEATIEVKLPDSLTSYRVWAVVVNDKQYGIGESNLEVQLPVMIRPSPPRFLNFGDKASISVVIQNQTSQPLDVRVGLRAANATVLGNGGVKFTLGGSKRHAVTFPVTTSHVGTARFQFFVTAPGFSDAAEVALPVYTPATSEAFATYGDVDEKSVVLQPVRAPTDAFAEFGGLQISTSSTQLQSLTDAVLYLWQYQYECAEQLSSRLIGILALRDVLQAFAVPSLPSADELRTKLAKDIASLQTKQHENGGFGWWSGSSSTEWLPNPYVSIHSAAAIAMAVDKKLDVPASVVEKSTSYVTNIEVRIREYEIQHHMTLDVKSRNALIAYALYVRTKLGQNVVTQALALWANSGTEHTDISLEAIGWILVALSKGDVTTTLKPAVDAIRSLLFAKVNETADTANFITSYGDDGQSVMLHSNRRTDASLLEGLLFIDPTNKLLPKLAKGLLAHRVKGAWNSTQENCFILIALDKYFHVFEKHVPDFIARVWIGQDFAGEQTFKGRSTNTNQLSIPMTYIMQPVPLNESDSVATATGSRMLAIQKEGTGRLYYRIGLNYAPTSLSLPAVNYGFLVTRSYSGVDNVAHVKRDSNGIWRFKLGEKIKVNLTMATTTRRYHVALCDYLPAGIEPLNPELIGSSSGQLDSSVTRSRGYNPWTSRFYQRHGWTEHTNLRDERAEAFRSLLWEGVYEWSYTARATTIGEFIAPPTKAEEMYSPENFGRSSTDRVIVEE